MTASWHVVANLHQRYFVAWTNVQSNQTHFPHKIYGELCILKTQTIESTLNNNVFQAICIQE